jgi:class 3 adenylate cyclase/tetratricopeptide (TPR) repeat protein
MSEPLSLAVENKYIESAAAYIPIDRQYALASERDLPNRANGSAVFADISGFTPLTEGLTRALGPERGAEELVIHLDRVYTALISEVDRFGGSVIAFSGDAITCWFDGDDARAAIASGFAIQKAMQQFATVTIPHSSPVSITVKVAVASGPIRRFIVGDPSIQLLDVLAGTTVDRLAATEEVAEKGEVVLDELTLGSLASIAQLSEWRTRDSARYAVISEFIAQVQPKAWAPLAPDALGAEQVRSWVLPPVYERLKRGQGKFLAEFRHAIVLFLNFSGIDYDNDEAAGDKLDTFIRWAQRTIARYEGTLISLTIGDKGSYLEVAFGAPITHDDDALRAVAAAFDLRALPDELSFINQIKIGISGGSMRTGAYGSASRLTYGIHGDHVNLAARLMQRAAPQQILVSERVTAAVAPRYRLNPLGALHIKGKQDTVNVFQVLEKEEPRNLPSLHAPMPLVGRIKERTLLAEKLRALRGQKISSVVIIEGDAGIGKSRLLEYLRQEGQASSVTSLVGSGDEIEKATPYHAWRPVFAQLFKLDALPDDKAARRAHVQSELESSLAPDLVRFAPFLNAILPLDFQDNELTAQMSGQLRSENTNLLLAQLLQHLAAAWPLTVLLEDAQWFDSASWALSLRVAREVRPILQVIATRPLAEPLPLEFRNLLDDAGTVQMSLEPLPTDDVRALIGQTLGVKTLPREVTELIREKAEGNPFFSEELAYALRDTGVIIIRGSECQIAPNMDLRSVTFPDTVQEVVTSRIDRLTATEQLTIKVASVIGRVFLYRILHDTFPIDDDKPLLKDHLSVLERLDLTLLETPEPELAYLFKHVITQEVSYSLLLFSQRRELHRLVAEWYERNHADDLSPYYALLAHDWSKAEVPARAIEYLERAGEKALRNFANEEAVSFFEQALKLAAGAAPEIEPLRTARWDLQAGEAYVNLSKYVEGRAHLEAGLALLDQPVPKTTGGEVVNVLSQVLRQVLHRRLPGRYIGRQSSQRENLLTVARAYERLSEATYFLGETLLPVYSAFRGLNLAEAAGPSPELGRSSAAVGAILGFIPLHRIAQSYLSRALDTAQASEHLESREFVSMTASYYFSGVGAWAKELEQAEQVLALAKLLGDVRRWEDVTSHVIAARYLQGDFAGSLKLADQLYAAASRRRDSRFMALALQAKAYCELYSGKSNEAMETLQSMRTSVSEGDELAVLSLKMEMLGLLSVAYLRARDHEKALETAGQVMNLTKKSTPSYYAAITGYTGPAEVYLTLWETKYGAPKLEQHAREACRTLGKYARVFPIGQAWFRRCQGRYDWLAGKHSKALNAWSQSLARAEKLGMLYDQGLAHYEIARHLSRDDPAHREHASRAIDIFSRVNAIYDLDLAHAL